MDDVDLEEIRTILGIESRFWRYAGRKEQAIVEQTGMSGTRFYQRLNQLLDEPNLPKQIAREFAPTIARLRRLRAERLQQRTGRLAG